MKKIENVLMVLMEAFRTYCTIAVVFLFFNDKQFITFNGFKDIILNLTFFLLCLYFAVSEE